MLNLKDFLMHTRKYKDGLWDPYTPTSEAFYHVLKEFINKQDKILECGSSTGHISYRLAKEGYDITLLDIRPEAIDMAKKYFGTNKVIAHFICSDIFNYEERYDFIWSSGLVQCYNDEKKEELIRHLSSLTNKMLLFYPDTESEGKTRGTNELITPGVGDAKEYGIEYIPEIAYRYFNKVYLGVLNSKSLGLSYNMYWLYASN